MNDIDLGLSNQNLEQGHPALIQFSYKFTQPWQKVAEAMLRIQDYESRNRLTSIAKVEQLDDDRLVVYRRSEFSTVDGLYYETLTLNRQNKSIENDRLQPNPNGTNSVLERQLLRPEVPSKDNVTVFDSYLHDYCGSQAGSIEAFKKTIGRLSNTMNFMKWDKEQ